MSKRGCKHKKKRKWHALSDEHRNNISKTLRGRKKTIEHIQKVRLANLGKKRPKSSGDKNPSWKGGITPINTKIRNSIEYALFRENVFRRDNYICSGCGSRGGKLHMHHIKSFALHPNLRFDFTNVVTLCLGCHKKTDSYLKNPYICEKIGAKSEFTKL